ncbi:MAG: sigma-70 family RNA polymerase sigma factor [Pseudomonadota bacterium]
MDDTPDITRLLASWQGGDAAAFEALSPIVYDELRRIAGRLMRGEAEGHSLQATALVNEAFLSLLAGNASVNDRQHFFSLAARIMRRALVDHARSKSRQKRGGEMQRLTLKTSAQSDGGQSLDVLELDDALTRLGEKDPTLVQAVELIYFGGLSYEDTAAELGLSRTVLVDELKFAKAWLRRAMS